MLRGEAGHVEAVCGLIQSASAISVPFGPSRREREEPAELALCYTNAEIAAALCVSPPTAAAHVKQVLAK